MNRRTRWSGRVRYWTRELVGVAGAGFQLFFVLSLYALWGRLALFLYGLVKL